MKIFTSHAAAIMLLSAFFLAVSCSQETDLPYKYQAPILPDTPYDYRNPDVSTSFGFQINPQNFNVDNDKAALGRVLFYDQQLSINGTTSCGSCHEQALAFADGKKGSEGFDGGITTRNSMSIANPFMNSNFFWDARIDNLEDMVLKPIQNHVEMGMERISHLEAKLARIDYYEPLFEKAYGDKDVNRERIAESLATFLRSIVSGNAKIDRFHDTWDFSTFTAQEEAGWNIFFGEGSCYRCHSGANLDESGDFFWTNTLNSANIGLEEEYTDLGMGVYLEDHDGEFRVPSLRNVSLTAPYMHDGRFETLEEVVEHYNSGIKNHPNLDERLRTFVQNGEGLPQQLNLSTEQKAALVAFLNTFTDDSMLSAPRFADPFEE